MQFHPDQSPLERATLLAGLALATWLLLRLVGKLIRLGGKKRLHASVLDYVLMSWVPGDDLTLKGLLDGGILIIGRPGSGKSSSSSYALLKACVAHPRSGGLILAASPSDLAMVLHLFAGRMDRLIVFDSSAKLRCNATAYILKSGGSVKDILSSIYAIAETIDRHGSSGGGSGGDSGNFFSVAARRLIENSIVIVKLATGTVSPADLLAFINNAATSLAEMHSEEFKRSLHYQFLGRAYAREKSPADTFDCELATSYFTTEFPKMAERTKTSIIAVVMNILHIFNSGNNRLLFATDSTISPDVMDEGKWVFVNQPISSGGEEAAFSLGVWRFLTQFHAMKRDPGMDNPPLIIHVDEFHNTINAYDTRFLGECRKFSSCMIACSQSKASFVANMRGNAAEAQVDALLNNFSHKVIHALGDIDSARWASEIAGQAMQLNLSGSEQMNAGGLFDTWMGNGVWTGSLSETMRPLLEPHAFMHGLRTGGAKNGYLCDAVVIRSGELFESTRLPYLKTAFFQERIPKLEAPAPPWIVSEFGEQA